MTASVVQHSQGVWQRLEQLAEDQKQSSITQLFESDPDRLRRYDLNCQGLRFNYALQNISEAAIEALLDLARARDLAGWRQRMYRGDLINTTERRAVLHVALRQSEDAPIYVDGCDITGDIRATCDYIMALADSIRKGDWLGASGQPIRDVVNIGIGGSDLGPRLVVKALSGNSNSLRVHFIANVDAAEAHAVLAPLDPATTLFVVVSKTFTTQETLMNARLARRWLTDKLGKASVARHFLAVSTNRQAVQDFGIALDHILPMWDWVGGRFSLWSAVGLSIALAIGGDGFAELLRGAAAMDRHFVTQPHEKNIPVLMGLLGIWNRCFLNYNAWVILPYAERLRELPRYLQQLVMESNGKSVTRDGLAVTTPTAPIIFGEAGTIGQHSFHQWLHQGTDIVPADFIGILADDQGEPMHHRALLTNMMAQMGVMAFGQPDTASPHDRYPGNRPVTLLTLGRLDPWNLGLLLAAYEHKTFVEGVLLGINSFDQPGVELGKRMARSLGSEEQTKDDLAVKIQHLYDFFINAKT